MEQVTVEIPKQVLDHLDKLVADGRCTDRADAIRMILRNVVEAAPPGRIAVVSKPREAGQVTGMTIDDNTRLP